MNRINMNKSLAGFILLLTLVLNCFAQSNWHRYSWGTVDREGFSILLPTIPAQILKGNREQGISASVDSVRFEVTFRDGVTRAEFEKQITAATNGVGGGPGMGRPRPAVGEVSNRSAASVCGYEGVEVSNSESIQQFYLVNNRLYHVSVNGAGKSDPLVEKFLQSFSLIKPWRPWRGIRANENSGVIEDPPFAPDPCENIETTGSEKAGATLPRNSPLQLLTQPSPVYPEEARSKRIQGTVTLSVMFLADGTIGDVSVVKGINKAFNESAMEAAKQIQFEPQRRNGKPVSIRKTVEYSFSIF